MESKPAPTPPQIDPEKREFGLRLAGARKHAGLTQQQVATRFGVEKGTVSAWETGRGLPDVMRFRSLLKLYHTTADQLLWDSAVSYESMQFAAMYEGLSETKRRLLRALWDSILSDAAADERVEAAFGAPPPPAPAAKHRERH